MSKTRTGLDHGPSLSALVLALNLVFPLPSLLAFLAFLAC